MPGFKIDNMGEIIFASVDELSVSDVYDLACEIGKECEGLIATVGPDPVNSLIKKVIWSLELLERFATKNEQENAVVQEMSQRIEKLEAEKQQKTESRHKFEKEIETVEEQWRAEFHRLQDENKMLQCTLGNRSVGTSSKESNGDVTAELENMQKVFRNEVENHKTEMRRREEEINMQQEEVVALQLQVETLKATNVDGKRFQRELQGQIRTLVDERTNLITRIQDQHTEIVALKRPLGAQTAKEEVINCKSDSKGADPETCANSTRELSSYPDDDAPPVQGPMPYEPDDAPWKRRSRRDSESGIRKFFRQLFLETTTDKPSFSLPKIGTSTGI